MPSATTTDTQTFSGLVADVVHDRIFPGNITVRDGRIAGVESDAGARKDRVLTPGFVDAHVHVESSLLTPAAFGRAAAVHGTVATVSDPHEIANVLGVPGVLWMLENAKGSPVSIHFGAPSCVPATPFETAGAAFGAAEVERLLSRPDIGYLAEVMNFPGVLAGDPKMLAILEVARRLGKAIDGHAPGLVGEGLARYAAAGIQTDHECVTLEEARQRAALGMFVAIREGSAARNFDALAPLLRERPERCFLCSDDKHPDDLVEGHINRLVARAIASGARPMDALRAATLNPVRHYRLGCGLLRPGDSADFAVLEDLETCRALETWIGGRRVAAGGRCEAPAPEPPAPEKCPNNFARGPVAAEDFALPWGQAAAPRVRAIVALDGQLLTREEITEATVRGGALVADAGRDLLKIAVVNRYEGTARPAVGFIKNFGLRRGAMASSVSHDSHNIVAVGADDFSLAAAVNAVVAHGGGLSFAADWAGRAETLPLPVAGLMSNGECADVAAAFTRLTAAARGAGCALRSPYMTLSFMALLVIPKLKIGDKGLFDVDRFAPAGLLV